MSIVIPKSDDESRLDAAKGVIKDFLESVPPGTTRKLENVAFHSGLPAFRMPLPMLELHCELCDGRRMFKPDVEVRGVSERLGRTFLSYECRNCSRQLKTYAIQYRLLQDSADVEIVKVGEEPGFGEPLPTRLQSLLGSEWPMMVKGKRAESQSLGIGAFAYYRRVVENKKQELFGEIRRALVRLEAEADLIRDIDSAIKEQRFANAVDQVKHALPPALMIGGRNPLTALHSALSESLHGQSDEECLIRAAAVRTVLATLADRLAELLRSDKDLDAAMKKLLSAKGQTKTAT